MKMIDYDPLQWYLAGETLKRIADGIHTRIEKAHTAEMMDEEIISEFVGAYPVYLMLMGYALENIAKGLIIGKEAEKPSTGGCPMVSLHCLGIDIHDTSQLLDKLANNYGLNEIRLTGDEKEILSTVLEFVTWQARYPISKKGKGHYGSAIWKSEELKGNKKFNRELIDLYDKLARILNDRIKDRQVRPL